MLWSGWRASRAWRGWLLGCLGKGGKVSSDPEATTKNWLVETLDLMDSAGEMQGNFVLQPSAVLERMGFEDLPEVTRVLDQFKEEAPEVAARQLARLQRVQVASKPSGSTDEGPPAILGRFELLDELGRGGMGRVMAAWDPELGRMVAVKVLLEGAKTSRNLLQRFVTEAKVTAQLEHPNIVPVYDMGISDCGEVYFAMRRVQGRSLWSILSGLRKGEAGAQRWWTRHRLLHAFVQVCNAVGFAHDRKVLHRDLKPENIMLGGHGEVLLLDWGLARLIGGSEELSASMSMATIEPSATVVGSVLGSPGYMSPEQAAGDLDSLDARSDVWSLGAVLYEILTLAKAYPGKSAETVLKRSQTGPPEDPRVRAPLQGIPDGLAEICLRAMAEDPSERFATANDISEVIENFLAGSQRREAALKRVVEAESAWRSFERLSREREDLAKRLFALERDTKPWLPLTQKTDLLGARQRTREIERERAARFSETVAGCEQALSQDPTNQEAHGLLARASFKRMLEAEATGHEIDRVLYRDRVLRHGSEELKAKLQAQGTFSLLTDPPGAEVICERFDVDQLPWALVDRQVLGETPLSGVRLDAGSYRLSLSYPGKRDTIYPVQIDRGAHWDSGEKPVVLYSEAQIGTEWVYVPPGPFLYQGDRDIADYIPASSPVVDGFFIQRVQVTMAEYCVFINEVAARDSEEAWARVPRQASELKDGSGQYWSRPEDGQPFTVPEMDRDGDYWDPNWPASAVSWDDAVAYAEWYSGVVGLPVCLPLEIQWEKAARGVDGRLFPWGNEWDSSLAAGRDSQPGRPEPSPVGTVLGDRSIYRMQDAAGCSMDWCGDASYNEDPGRRPVRGGHWLSQGKSSRVSRRHGVYPNRVITSQGFRLARARPFADPEEG